MKVVPCTEYVDALKVSCHPLISLYRSLIAYRHHRSFVKRTTTPWTTPPPAAWTTSGRARTTLNTSTPCSGVHTRSRLERLYCREHAYIHIVLVVPSAGLISPRRFLPYGDHHYGRIRSSRDQPITLSLTAKHLQLDFITTPLHESMPSDGKIIKKVRREGFRYRSTP